MTDITTTNFGPFFKTHYAKKAEELTFRDNPLYARIRKDKTWGGGDGHIPFKYYNPQGRSATASNAFGNQSEIGTEAWALTRVTNYGSARISGQTLSASKQKPEAFLDALTAAIDGEMQEMANDTEFALFRDSYGVRGRIVTSQSITGATVMTLETAADALNFDVGMEIVASTASDGTGIKQTSSVDNALTVSAVDYDAGTVTFDAAVDSFSSNDWAAGDYLYVQGDPALKLSGLAAWLPATAPGATSFFGVNRSVNPVRLGGIRHNGSGQTIQEAIIDAANKAAAQGARPNACYMSFGRFGDLCKELGSAVVRQQVKVGEVGFESIKFYGPKGPIDVIPSRGCGDTVSYLVDESTLLLSSIGEPIQLDDRDGVRLLRVASSDSFEIRLYSYFQMCVTAPGRNVRITMP